MRLVHRDARVRRMFVGAAVTLFAATLAVAVGSGTAHAARVPCPTDAQYQQTIVARPHINTFFRRYTVLQVTPRFLVSDGRSVSNGLNHPIDAMVTANETRTFQLTTTVGLTNEVTEQLTLNVSASIVQTRSTAIGVSTSFTVQPGQTVLAEYGLNAFDITYSFERWKKRHDQNFCEELEYTVGTTTAPTVIEGWRFTFVRPATWGGRGRPGHAHRQSIGRTRPSRRPRPPGRARAPLMPSA